MLMIQWWLIKRIPSYNLKYLNKMQSMEEMNQNIKYHYL